MKCDGCNAPCCKKFIKFITIHDATKIIDELKLEAVHFLDLRLAEGIESPMPRVLIQNKPYLLALDSKMAKNDCIFLLEIGNSKRCGIHSSRPSLCRTYPFDFEGGKLKLVDSFLCPRQYYPEGEEREKYIQIILQAQEEMKEYTTIVEKWNDLCGDRGNLLDFIEFAKDKLNLIESKR